MCATVVMSMVMTTSVFAGTWKNGEGENQNKWWYDNGNGAYTSNGWQWIDSNNDGVAECYYFDENGWLLSNTTTPDGYQVNNDGAWVQNGEIVTQKSTVLGKAQLSETRSNHKIPSVLVMQKGRPIKEGVPEGIYSAWQLESETYDIVADSLPAEIRNQENGYYRIYDERGFLVREYRKRPDYVHPFTGEVIIGKASSGKAYEYDDNGKLKVEWDLLAYSETQDARTMVPTMNDIHNEYEYDGAGRLIRKWTGKTSSRTNGYTEYFYDADGRLIKAVTNNRNASGAHVFGGVENQRNYIYNDNDGTINVTQGITEQWTSSQSVGVGYSGMFVCDEQGRIIERQLGSTAGAPSGIYRYTYDEVGRIIKTEFLNSDRSVGTYSEYTYRD